MNQEQYKLFDVWNWNNLHPECYIQGSQKWHEMRRRGIGSSDAAVIMGVSPWKTPFQLWEEKLQINTECIDNEAMKHGRDNEENARKEFERQNNLVVFQCVKHKRGQEFLFASLDGMDMTDTVSVELKCPFKPAAHNIVLEGRISDHYYPQLQHQMMVTEHSQMYFFSYYHGKGVTLICKRNDEYINKLLEAELEFYKCMINLNPPSLTERDYSKRNDTEWNVLTNEWKMIHDEASRLDSREKDIRKRLIELADNKNTIGNGIKVSKLIRKGNVDYEKIIELHDIDVDKYRKPVLSTWRISSI